MSMTADSSTMDLLGLSLLEETVLFVRLWDLSMAGSSDEAGILSMKKDYLFSSLNKHWA